MYIVHQSGNLALNAEKYGPIRIVIVHFLFPSPDHAQSSTDSLNRQFLLDRYRPLAAV